MLLTLRHSSVTKWLSAVLLALSLASNLAHANETTDSIATIEAALPDSMSLNGQITYVDFWASWCLPCKQSFPWMEKLYTKYHKQGLSIVAVCVDKEHKAALEFLDDSQSSFTIIFDSTGSIAKQYELKALPTSYLYNSSGQLVLEKQGFNSEETESVESKILQLLRQKKTLSKEQGND